MNRNLTRTYIGIGSNLDDPVNNVLRAVEQLKTIGELVSCSSLYRTKPWGYVEQPDFVNAVVALDVDCSAQQLMQSLLYIEKKEGRERLIKWGPRLIDLDILLFGNLKISKPSLTIPHPYMYKRAFVLVPLAEIDSRFIAAMNELPKSVLAQVKLMDISALESKNACKI